MIIPPVRAFRDVEASKAQALKPLEEAAEVFGAWQYWLEYGKADGEPDECYGCIGCEGCGEREALVNECCDVIVATCNLLAALGITDLTEAMAECERRNEVRGRYGE